MVNRSALGKVGEPFVVEVERGKIREFARAIFSDDPAYLSDERPVSPPTFLTTAVFWQEGDADPWPAVETDVARSLHAEQEFVLHGPPPRAGTRLTAQSRIDQMYDKQGRRGGSMTFVVMVTEFRDDTGRLVAESRMTSVETAPVEEPGEGEV